MLRLKPTFEEIEREAKTRRLRILPERERRTQQGILLDDVDFNDFDLDKGVQTDMFFNSSLVHLVKVLINPKWNK